MLGRNLLIALSVALSVALAWIIGRELAHEETEPTRRALRVQKFDDAPPESTREAPQPLTSKALREGARSLDTSNASEALARSDEARRMQGRVLNGTGLPVAGAVVQLYVGHAAIGTATPLGKSVVEVTTVEDGTFLLDYVLRYGQRYVARVSHADYCATTVAPIDPIDLPSYQRDIVMNSGARVQGVTVDSKSRPLSGVTIRVLDEDHALADGEGPQERASESDAQGRFVLTAVSPGRKRLIAMRSGLGTAQHNLVVPRAAAAVEGIELKLGEGSVIAGRVEDIESGVPLAKIRLKLRPVSFAPPVSTDPATRGEGRAVRFTNPGVNPAAIESQTTETDADGAFRFEGVENRLYTVMVVGLGQSPGYSVNAQGGKTDVVVKVRALGLVSGRVVDGAKGQPVASFSVSFSATANPLAVAWSRRQQFDGADGRFLVQNADARAQFLVVESPGYVTKSFGPYHLGPRETVHQLELAIDRGASLLGFVRDAAGEPVLGARVQVLEERPAPLVLPGADQPEIVQVSRGDTVTFADGSYALTGVGVGRYLVEVRHPEHVTTKTVPVDLGISALHRMADVVLVRAASIRGVVLDTQGQPDHQAVVLVMSVDGSGSHEQAATDGEGQFLIKGLRPGDYRVGVVQRKGVPDPAAMMELRSRAGSPTTLHPGELKSVEIREQ